MLRRPLVLTALLLTALPASAQQDPVPAHVATGTQFAVATESPYAARAAYDVLARGGSAVDAAISAVLDLGVTYQDECGLGGGGFLVHRDRDGGVRTIDFREESPLDAYSDGVMNRSVPGSTYETGHDVIGVPGTLAGLALAHDLGGRLPWASLFEAALRDAREGYRVSPRTAGVLHERRQDVQLFEETRRTYTEADGTVLDADDLHVQPDLAATLERLATRTTEEAREEFYRSGVTAQRLLATFAAPSPYEAHGDDSPIVARDLLEYRAELRTPVVTEYRDHEVIGMGPPSSGGVAIAEILNVLEHDDLEAVAPGERVHLLAEAQKVAFADRATWMGDPDHVRIPVDGLTSQPYADLRRADIRSELAQSYASGGFEGYEKPGSPSATDEGPQTTHVSVVDRHGEAVAVTCSLERGLGSAVVAPGTGILLNGQLHDFDEGAPDGAANAYAPGKRPRSSMSPTIVVKDGQVLLVAGAQSGPKIIMAVLQAVLGVVDAGMPVREAVARSRVHVERRGPLLPTLTLEHVPRTPEGGLLYADLVRRGHLPFDAYEQHDPYPATVAAVHVAQDGTLTAVNDERGFLTPESDAVPGSLAR